jgi:hypothetical protein
MSSLAPGATLRLAVDPRPLFVPSGIYVAPGERYRFAAAGRWRDWFRNVDADGWSCPWLPRHNRVPGAPFFRLCGCVGTDDRLAFAIGRALPEWRVPDGVAALPDRQLYFFANDWGCLYFNNHALDAAAGGPLRVEITRLPRP